MLLKVKLCTTQATQSVVLQRVWVAMALNGVSGGGTYPKLAGQHAAYTVKQLKDYKAGKDRPNAIMGAFAGMMTEEDMINVAVLFRKANTWFGYR